MIKEFMQESNYLIIKTEKHILKVQAISDDMIRILYTGKESFSCKKSLMVIEKEYDDIKCFIEDNLDTLIFSTSNIRLVINKKTLSFIWMDRYGKLLIKEPKRGGKYLLDKEVTKPIYEPDIAIKQRVGIDGIRSDIEPIRYDFDRMAYSTKLEFEFDEVEAIYGLGQHEDGVYNQRGNYQFIYQQNMNIAVPFFISTNGYGFLFDSNSLGAFHDDKSGSFYFAEIEEEMDFYFIYGPEFDQIIHQYRYLTGDSPMLPKWAYGFVQSKERYSNQQELLDIVDKYRELEVPLDCIVQDWRYWKDEYWSEKSFDPKRYPNPQELVDQLHDKNVKLMISIWPLMAGNGPNRKELLDAGYMYPDKTTYNPYSQESRDIYWNQCYDGLFKYGLDAWWCDCTEPFENDWNGTTKRPPFMHVMEQTTAFKKNMDAGNINTFSLPHSQGMYEGQRSISNKRVVNLTRSFFPGQQRYSTITWSGDTAASWKTLKNQIAEGLNFCSTGAPKWTLDIGAFFVNDKQEWFWHTDYTTGSEDLGYRELYTRWYQLGAFLPMFRSHGTDTAREIWNFGKKGEMFYDSIEKFTHLRYRLMPYIYTLAGMETHNSYTMFRNLAFDFRDDKNVYDIADQFMFGPSIMVCPIIEPMYYESDSTKLYDIPKKRNVYLPQGQDWYNFWTGELFAGGQTISIDAPIDRMPLFVKAGSIIPMGSKVQYSNQKPNAPWDIYVYPSKDSEFSIYEDAGDGYEYEKGEYCYTPISYCESNATLTIGNRYGHVFEDNSKRVLNIILVKNNEEYDVFSSGNNCQVQYAGNDIKINL